MFLFMFMVTVLAVFMGSVLHWRGWRAYWMMWKLPGLNGIPILGVPWTICVLRYRDMLPFGTNNFKKLKMLTFNLFGIPVVIMNDAEDIKFLLENSTNIQKGFEYNCFRPWLREGLLVSHGKKWVLRRKLLTPTFHFEILETSIGGVWRNSNVFVNKLLESGGKSFNVENIVRLYTLDVICETAMGIELNAQKEQGREYVEALKRVIEVVLKRALQTWLQAEWIFRLTPNGRTYHNDLRILHNFSEQVIASKRKVYEAEDSATKNKNMKRRFFLDCLIALDEANPGLFTPLDIREEVDTFMFEGHDTTSSAIIFALYLLANHPEEQEEAVAEQFEIFGDEWREPTMKELQSMIYLETVIKESLRLFPSVPYLSRTLTQDLVLSDNMVVPKGANAGVSIYHTHRNPKYWDDPNEFKPSRFAPGNTRHPFAYLAFSAGPRNCIGQKFAMLELKTTLSAVLRRCRLEPVTRKVCLEPVVILKNVEPIQLRVIPREPRGT